MPRVLLFAAGLLMAWATSSASAQAIQRTPIHGETPGHTCQTSGTARFIGKIGTKMMGAAIKSVSRAAVLRWAPPGIMLTMDFRSDRVNVYVDERKKIIKINCG